VAGASAIIGFSVVSVCVVISGPVGSIVVGGISGISSSVSSEIYAVGGIIVGVLRMVEGSTSNNFSVVLMFAGACAAGVIVGGIVQKSAPMLSSSWSVNCSICCCW